MPSKIAGEDVERAPKDSLMRFSIAVKRDCLATMSPRAQYTSYNLYAGQSIAAREVTTQLGFSLASICSALATTRRGRLQLSLVW